MTTIPLYVLLILMLVGILLLPIGSICILASNSIPTSYLACDGSKYLISEYPDLFVVIGSTFNQNGIDATSYFNVPDLRGRFVKGLDTNHTLGQFEKYATALPTLPFLTDSQGLHTHTTDSQGSHSHDIRIGQLFQSSVKVSGDYASSDKRTENGYATLTTAVAGEHTHNLSSNGLHTHNVVSGGDVERQYQIIYLSSISLKLFIQKYNILIINWQLSKRSKIFR